MHGEGYYHPVSSGNIAEHIDPTRYSFPYLHVHKFLFDFADKLHSFSHCEHYPIPIGESHNPRMVALSLTMLLVSVCEKKKTVNVCSSQLSSSANGPCAFFTFDISFRGIYV